MDRKIILLLCVVLVLGFGLTACIGGKTPPPPAEESLPGNPINNGANGENNDPENHDVNVNDNDQPNNDNDADADTQDADEAPADDSAPADDFTPQPPDPQPVEILSTGDRVLEGYYFPASVPDAPVVVLMHWAPEEMVSMSVIAAWLQNRGWIVEWPTPDSFWYDQSWFPPMPEESSFAVLIYNSGGWGNSPAGPSREDVMWDAVSALKFASTLPGTDPDQITALGASIGADGAPDACYLFNESAEIGTCLGALSFSPGNYLTKTFTYQEAVATLDLDGHPVWCLAADGDFESPELCRGIAGTHTRSFIFPGGSHGMELLAPDYFPTEPAMDFNALQLIQEFLEAVTGTQLNGFDLP